MIYSVRDFIISTNYVFTHLPDVKQVINTINPHSMVVAQADSEFKNALLDSDILIPDGIGIVMTAQLLWGIRFQKLAGSELHSMILGRINDKGGRCFYMGASQAVIDRIKNNIRRDFKNIVADGYSPPYKESFSDDDNQIIVGNINDFRPDVLFVGMTAPKQEKWVQQYKGAINARLICSIGGAFDFYAGTKKRAPKWVRNCGLEWLPRLIREPGRMWRRNFISTPRFIFLMLRTKIHDLKLKPKITIMSHP